jgi:hypothetical protein
MSIPTSASSRVRQGPELGGPWAAPGEQGSAVGASYRHTTPEMEARVRAAVQERLRLVRHGVPRSLVSV